MYRLFFHLYYSAVAKWIKTSTIFSMLSTGIYSCTPWKFTPPVERFGHGRPIYESRAPSVPPRMGTSRGFTPAFYMAALARWMRYIWGSICSFIL